MSTAPNLTMSPDGTTSRSADPTDPATGATGTPGATPDPVAEARAAVSVGLWISATRCVLTYLVAPSLGLVGIALGALGLVLQVLGLVTSVVGARRLHRLGSRWWRLYAGVAALVGATTLVALVDAAGLLR